LRSVIFTLIFSRPYFSEDRAIGMSCRLLIVCLAVTAVLWLTGSA